ncbi:hypothetical protein [Streptomyces klenkii]
MTLADKWSDPAIVVGVVAMVVSGALALAAIVVARRAAFPKRRLTYQLPKPARILAGASGVSPGRLVVMHEGSVLDDPYVAEVVVANAGRRDIPSSSFDGGNPMFLDLGVPIIEILDTTRLGPTHALLTATVSGSTLVVPAALIPTRHVTRFTVLVDGEPSLTVRAALADVDVRCLPAEGERPIWRRTEAIFFFVAILLAVIAPWLAGGAGIVALCVAS